MLILGNVGERERFVALPAGALGELALVDPVHDVEVAHLVLVGGTDVGEVVPVADLHGENGFMSLNASKRSYHLSSSVRRSD